MAQLDVCPTGDQRSGHGFNPHHVFNNLSWRLINDHEIIFYGHSLLSADFMEIDHEIFSLAILSLPLIQEGQLSVSRERMCTNTG